MSSVTIRTFHLETGVRWVGRLLAAFLVGLVLLIFVGEGGLNPFKLSVVEVVQMVFFFTTCIGMVVGWRWQVLGGILASTGILLFFATEFAVTGAFPRGWVFRLMLLPGPLYLLSGFLKTGRPATTSRGRGTRCQGSFPNP